MKEYVMGMGHEIYRTKLSTKQVQITRFERRKFNELAAFIYKEFKGILFGIEMKVDDYAMVILNPGDFEIPDVVKNDVHSNDQIHAYLICEDKKVADEIAYYEMSQEEISEAARNSPAHDEDSGEDQMADEEDGLMTIIDGNDNEQTKLSRNESEEAEEEDYLESDYELLEGPLSLLACTKINLRVSF